LILTKYEPTKRWKKKKGDRLLFGEKKVACPLFSSP